MVAVPAGHCTADPDFLVIYCLKRSKLVLLQLCVDAAYRTVSSVTLKLRHCTNDTTNDTEYLSKLTVSQLLAA